MSRLFLAVLQMGSGGMMPSFDLGSMWLYMVLPSVVVGGTIIILVFLFLHRERTGPSTITSGFAPSTAARPGGQSLSGFEQPAATLMGDVFRSLAPTLMDDEKRVMDELARARGEVLQSDLPRMTNFSKATVSKVIHSLEVRGIVVREKHKWTYWCRINPRLVERVQRGELTVPNDKTLEPVGA